VSRDNGDVELAAEYALVLFIMFISYIIFNQKCRCLANMLTI